MAKNTRRPVSGQEPDILDQWEELQGQFEGLVAVCAGIVEAASLTSETREDLLQRLRHEAESHPFRPAFHRGKSRVMNLAIRRIDSDAGFKTIRPNRVKG